MPEAKNKKINKICGIQICLHLISNTHLPMIQSILEEVFHFFFIPEAASLGCHNWEEKTNRNFVS